MQASGFRCLCVCVCAPGSRTPGFEILESMVGKALLGISNVLGLSHWINMPS